MTAEKIGSHIFLLRRNNMFVKEDLMKKIFALIFSFVLLSVPSFAQSQNNWYFVSKNQNDRPTLPSVTRDSAKGIGKEEKVLYLTFDAGYENGNVEKTVKILKENDVTGAFFVLRHFIEKNPDLCRTIQENGNLLYNHSSTHKNFSRITSEEMKQELKGLEEVCQNTLGFHLDPYFRPPEGAWNEETLRVAEEAGYKTVFWSLAWADWDNNNQKSPEYAMEKLLSRVHDGAVILLHPTSETNTKILGEFIVKMKEAGYRFASVEELWQ
jgi:peptidoglycan-N-acetylmuramic acid deacetylase